MKKNTTVKNKFKTYVVMGFAVIFLIFSVFVMISSLNIKTISDVNLLTYSEKNNVDYKVYLKENDYFTEEFLPENNQYIASLIDYIDMDFIYDYVASKNINADYNYKIVATITAQYKVDTNNSKKVWEKKYTLTEPKKLSIKDKKEFRIKENVKIDYQKYNSIINSFKKDYMLSVTSNLKVAMYIEVNGKYVPADKVFNTTNDIAINIPLSEQTLDIEPAYQEFINRTVKTEEEKNSFNNYALFVIALAVFIASAIVLGLQLKEVLKSDKTQNKYLKELNKLLHDFGDIIVEVKSLPEFDAARSIEVMNFNELVDAQLETKSPIIFVEIIKNEMGKFILVDKELSYYYILKGEENKR